MNLQNTINLVTMLYGGEWMVVPNTNYIGRKSEIIKNTGDYICCDKVIQIDNEDNIVETYDVIHITNKYIIHEYKTLESNVEWYYFTTKIDTLDTKGNILYTFEENQSILYDLEVGHNKCFKVYKPSRDLITASYNVLFDIFGNERNHIYTILDLALYVNDEYNFYNKRALKNNGSKIVILNKFLEKRIELTNIKDWTFTFCKFDIIAVNKNTKYVYITYVNIHAELLFVNTGIKVNKFTKWESIIDKAQALVMSAGFIKNNSILFENFLKSLE